MVPQRVSNHVERGLSLVLSQYRDRPVFEGWLASYLRQVQDLDDAAYDVLVSRILERASNAQLDLVGKSVGELRADRTDDAYRVLIAARIRVNRSAGHLQDVLDVYRILASTTPKRIYSVPPANLVIELHAAPILAPDLIFSMLLDTRAGGVGLAMVVPTAAPATQFIWGTVDDYLVPNATNGVGDVNDPASGGRLSTVLT